mmetsp:Transcript_24643/g.51205  ORF Transcript_24643/g.51205 Transcript_24643/m.51205 type:complete len:472 (-) Transcript_24643:98-1513(-)
MAVSVDEEDVNAGAPAHSDVRMVLHKIRPMWVPIFLGSISRGILLPNFVYIFLDFFARQYTNLPHDQIQCETTPSASYCKAAVNDNVEWSTIMGFVASAMHFMLGPFLGALSDTVGRRPVIITSTLLSLPVVIAFALGVYGDLSLYVAFALTPLNDLPVLAIWFAYVVDLLKMENDCSTAFGLITAAAMGSTMIGISIGSSLSVHAGLAVMLVTDLGMVVPYLIIFLPESLPKEKRKPMLWRESAPGLGMKILARNGLFMRLTLIVVGHTFLTAGFQRYAVSYVQKFLPWPKSANNMALGLGMLSSICWATCGLPCITQRAGDVGALSVAVVATILLAVTFVLMSTPAEVLVLIALFQGPGVLAFPAVSAIKSRLVSDHEQGLLQGALNTAKTVAEACGPLFFGMMFEAFDSSAEWTVASTTPIILGASLYLPILWLLADLPRWLKMYGHHGNVEGRQQLLGDSSDVPFLE